MTGTPTKNVDNFSTEQQEPSEILRLSNEVRGRICTSQVIVSMSGAARQLIDNSLDAHASMIEIRTKNNGVDSLEVIDDGCGIDPANFSSLGKAHATSKLRDLTDMNELTTLGFRGEALNALCALGRVTITTRTKDALIGTKLIFDHSGNIVEQTNVARQMGTTVAVEELFISLPVRRKEFERTAKREHGRLLATIQWFALSRTDVRFVSSNAVAGKRVNSICTPGKATVKEVVDNLFGGRSDKNKMLPIEKSVPDELICSNYGIDPNKTKIFDKIGLSGFVSSCEHGFGRSSSDRQFLYVNRRPVDWPKICRAVNEVYQQYNKSQLPTLVLYIDLPPESIDVNVTPDKRTVFFDSEKELVALFCFHIRASILATFQPVLGTYTSLEDVTKSQRLSQEKTALSSKAPIVSSQHLGLDSSLPNILDLIKSCSNSTDRKRVGSAMGGPSGLAKKPRDQGTMKLSQVFNDSTDIRGVRSMNDFVIRADSPGSSNGPFQSKNESTPGKVSSSRPGSAKKSSAKKTDSCKTPSFAQKQRNYADVCKTAERNLSDLWLSREISPQANQSTLSPKPNFTPPMLRNLSQGFDNSIDIDDHELTHIETMMAREGETNRKEADREREETLMTETVLDTGVAKVSNINDVQCNSSAQNDTTEQPTTATFYRAEITTNLSMSSLRERMKEVALSKNVKQQVMTQDTRFEKSFAKHKENEAPANFEDVAGEEAEKELSRCLKKTDFARMEIVGQFNKGFIVTSLDSDLFIVDQHASDEKKNFERFQKKARVDTQRLLQAQRLKFGAVQEAVLQDNIHVFNMNGFEFKFEQQGYKSISNQSSLETNNHTDQGVLSPDDGTCAAFLISVPVLHSWQFNTNDIDEILAMVSEFPGVMYRPAKLRKIFASRACRSSVMIGTALEKKKMLEIVQNLGTLDQPWNCPHGRPTMRHLVDLNKIGRRG